MQLRPRDRRAGPNARPASQPRGAGLGGDDLKGPESGDLKGTRVSARLQGKAGRAETRGCAIGELKNESQYEAEAGGSPRECEE